jgi:hypothetical protein
MEEVVEQRTYGRKVCCTCGSCLKCKRRVLSARHRSKNLARYRAAARASMAARRAADPQWARAHQLRSRYGITRGEYNALLAEQGGVCAICAKPEQSMCPRTGKPFELSVDHDRRCCHGDKSCGGCIRGLLCHRCNRSIGLLGDDPLLLVAALLYLRPSFALLSAIIRLLADWLHRVKPVRFSSDDEPSGPVKKDPLGAGVVSSAPGLTTVANALGAPPTLMEAPTPEMFAP